jgi:hypothetical protein
MYRILYVKCRIRSLGMTLIFSVVFVPLEAFMMKKKALCVCICVVCLLWVICFSICLHVSLCPRAYVRPCFFSSRYTSFKAGVANLHAIALLRGVHRIL